MKRDTSQDLTAEQQSRLTRLYFNKVHAVEAAALTGIHFERVKAFYATWDETEKEASNGV